jgi:hypothetical protein
MEFFGYMEGKRKLCWAITDCLRHRISTFFPDRETKNQIVLLAYECECVLLCHIKICSLYSILLAVGPNDPFSA